ncbi:MAG: hypothetical protein AVDCRST_MAG68-2430 [uncultured Gemmatimonadetes bacterium]|uniref:Uncharacterized protein n=1 Tax=uncultured Gemmatimonadota bacterium TaxID=203437 RepID=A0A6J4LER2_9BACT|nr:MAG: hypothetical protein AVDCRST_MAG68-2430 [uncultured Gemmatimonadota bacterium]
MRMPVLFLPLLLAFSLTSCGRSDSLTGQWQVGESDVFITVEQHEGGTLTGAWGPMALLGQRIGDSVQMAFSRQAPAQGPMEFTFAGKVHAPGEMRGVLGSSQPDTATTSTVLIRVKPGR